MLHLKPKPGFCIKSTSSARKVFINIAWDPNVPSAPEDGWWIPVNPREDVDKAGNPSAVFDCIFHTDAKSRTLRDPEFKLFLVELSLQRVEAQTGLQLSRSIASPNIPSKGKLLPRSVQIPPTTTLTHATPLHWTWSSDADRINFQIHVPNLSVSIISSSELYLSPRSLQLVIPDHPPLIIDLSLSDDEIAQSSAVSRETEATLLLKRERDFDVDGAQAEWKIGTSVVEIQA